MLFLSGFLMPDASWHMAIQSLDSEYPRDTLSVSSFIACLIPRSLPRNSTRHAAEWVSNVFQA